MIGKFAFTVTSLSENVTFAVTLPSSANKVLFNPSIASKFTQCFNEYAMYDSSSDWIENAGLQPSLNEQPPYLSLHNLGRLIFPKSRLLNLLRSLDLKRQ